MRNLSISAKVSLTIAALFAFLIILMLGIMARSSLDFARRQAVAQEETNMRIAWELLHREGAKFHIDGDQLMVDGHPLNGDFKTVDHIKALVGGVATIFRGDTRITTNVMKPGGGRAVGTQLAKGPVYAKVLLHGEPMRGEADILGKPYFVAYDPIKSDTGAVIGILFVGVAKADFFQQVYSQLSWMALAALIIALMGVAASVALVRRQLRPLQDIRAALMRVMSGDLDVNLRLAGLGGDVAEIGDAVHAFRDHAREKARIEGEAERLRAMADAERSKSEAEQAKAAQELGSVVEELGLGLSKLSSGDLTYRVTQNFDQKYQRLRDDFNAAAVKLQETMTTIRSTAASITSGSSEITQASDDLSRRTEQQAASLEQTAAALDQITATVRKTAEGVDHANAVVEKAKADAEKSGTVVHQAVAAMGEIETSSKSIGQIIGVIDEIAFQTNLLALNAGVEAARAGDAGRGFAVVASEVRALAQRSAQAAKEIKALVSASGRQVAAGVSLVGEAGVSLQRIADQISAIRAVVSEISTSAQEQATGLAEVNTAVNQMDHVTQQNAAMVEQSTAASHSLAQEAAALAELISQFAVEERTIAVLPLTKTAARPAVEHARKPSGAKVPASLGGQRRAAHAAAVDDWQEF